MCISFFKNFNKLAEGVRSFMHVWTKQPRSLKKYPYTKKTCNNILYIIYFNLTISVILVDGILINLPVKKHLFQLACCHIFPHWKTKCLMTEEKNGDKRLVLLLKVSRQSLFFFTKPCHSFIDIMLIRKETQPSMIFSPHLSPSGYFTKGTSAPRAKKGGKKRGGWVGWIKRNTSLGGHVQLHPNFITHHQKILKNKK